MKSYTASDNNVAKVFEKTPSNHIDWMKCYHLSFNREVNVLLTPKAQIIRHTVNELFPPECVTFMCTDSNSFNVEITIKEIMFHTTEQMDKLNILLNAADGVWIDSTQNQDVSFFIRLNAGYVISEE